MKIQITGINDRCENVPNWIQDINKNYLLLTELPITQSNATSVFSLLNKRNESYFSTKNQFTEYVNNYFNNNLGFKVNSMILNLIYQIKDKYVFCYPIGCIDEFKYKNNEVDNLIRFNRSVAITNNTLQILNDYQKTINLRILKMDELFNKLSQLDYLKSIYTQGNKINFLEEVLTYYFLYSGSESKNLKPSISKDVLEEMINVSFNYTKDEKVYINPLTFNKIYYKLKDSFNPERVNIIVGEPHRLFLEYFLSQKFPDVSSTSKTLNFLKTTKKTKYVIDDIKIVKKNNLIH
jgi:hypothetical protein